MNGICSMRVI